MQVLAGDMGLAAATFAAFDTVRRAYRLLPERFLFTQVNNTFWSACSSPGSALCRILSPHTCSLQALPLLTLRVGVCTFSSSETSGRAWVGNAKFKKPWQSQYSS